MNYILDFIKFITGSAVSIWGHLIVLIVGLIYIYTKREEYEINLGWKIIGFYLLGAFSLSFNTESIYIILPIGFTFYYFFMKNKYRLNSRIKKIAAIFGVIMLYIGALSNIINEKIEYRDYIITTNNKTINYISKDWNLIKNKLNIDFAEIKGFSLIYDKDNVIKILSYTASNYDRRYYIDYIDGKYNITVDKVNDENDIYAFDMHNGEYNMNIDQFMDLIDNIKFKRYDEADEYKIEYDCNLDGYYAVDSNRYSIDHGNYSLNKINSKEEIYEYTDIVYTPIKNMSDGSYKSIVIDQYFINYHYKDDMDMYLDKTITIEDVENNISKAIIDPYDVGSIVESMKESNWAEVKDLNIEIEPDLFVKDNDGNVIGLCKDETFARRDLDGVSVWYIVPSKLYNDVKLYLYN